MDLHKKRAQLESEELKEEEDSGDDTSNSEEGVIKFLFKSSLDVGSTFLKIEPEDEEIVFYPTRKGTMLGKVYLENMTPGANIAYYGWTSHSADFNISPPYGFIRPGEYLYVDFELLSENHEEVDQGLYFIKALPLSHNYDIDQLEDNLDEVFHDHNKNILFTLSTLNGDHNLDELAEEVQYDYHEERDNIIYTQEYKERAQREKEMEEERLRKEKGITGQPLQPEADSSVPDPEISKDIPRESDLLGLEEESREETSSNQGKIILRYF